MREDEWGMLINSPAEPQAPTSPTDAPQAPPPVPRRQGTPTPTDPSQFDWSPMLEQGEVVLWTGRPREGAGWRCILNDDLMPLFGVVGSVALGLAMVFANGTGNPVVWAVIGGLVLPATFILALTGRGARLAASRYAVTNRRSLSVNIRKPEMLAALHKDAWPERRETRCGSVIDVGRAKPYRHTERAGWHHDTDAETKPRVRFQALDPEAAPMALLMTLTQEARPPSANDLPWQPGFTR